MPARLTCAGAVAALVALVFAPIVSAQDLTLESTIAAALSHHPLVEAAQARVAAARGDRVTAAALPNPVATLWVENVAFPISTLPPLPAGLNREISTYVTVPLEPLIQQPSRVRRADEDIKAAEALLAVARRRVAADAAHAFFRVALAEVLSDEAEENWARVDDLAAYTRARVDEGVTAEGELLRVQVERDRLAADVVFAGIELTRRMGELAPHVDSGQSRTLTDLRVFVPELPSEADRRPVSSLAGLDELVARALERRPEIMAARAHIASAVAATDLERALAVRQLGAVFGNKHVEGRNSMVAGVTVTVPLFNRNPGGVARAAGERLAAEQELAWLERMITADVKAAYENASALTRQLSDLQESLVTRAESVDRFTLAAYREGGATLLQVLDAMRLHADARLTYSRIVLAQRESLFDLALAAGTDPIDAGARP